MAGLGAAMYTGGVGRGDSVAVFGCGGVGNAAIAGARLAGAQPDHRRRPRRRGSSSGRSEFGATHTVNSRDTDAVEAIRALTDGNGADVCIEAVGRPEVLEQAFYARDLAGTVVQVGVPDPDMRIDMPMIEFFGRGGALKPSWYGDCLPSRDFPMLIDLYLRAGSTSTGSCPRRSASTTSRTRSTRWSAARCCAPSSCCEARSASCGRSA